jgi:signal transduction histidine kinase
MLLDLSEVGPADQERIFKAFVTTKKNGMGLVWPYRVPSSQAHGGRLWAENNPSAGVTFNVALPVSPVMQTFDVS